ncbi:MAG: SAM-dependent methyltransferase [Parachlamydiaceae bacterium]|nr:SAM-dependent methyltransferase [Parachlamydiaceae bacterium]
MFSSIIVALFFFILIASAASIIYWTIRNGISPMPTSARVATKLLNSIPESIEGSIYELGSGWGTLAFPLAKKYPSNPIKAYENSPIPYLLCRLHLILFPQPNLSFHCSNFFDLQLNDAGLIVCYLYPGAMQKLKVKLEKSLNPGTLLVSNTFSIPGLKPINTVEIDDWYHSKIFVYKM